MNLEASSSIVTGGASGIGEASARQLAAAGSRVVIADLQEERGEALAAELNGMFVKCDVTKVEDAQEAVAAASDMGPLRALVNSAGLGFAGRTVDRDNNAFPLDKFAFVINVNLIGSFNMLAQAASAMAQTEAIDDDGSRGRGGEHGFRSSLRWPDRPGRVLGLQGWCGRDDPADRSRPGVGGYSGEHHRTGPHRHPDLR